MKTKITFYAGIHTIGGVIMAVEYGNDRVLLEIGTAYVPSADVFDGHVQPRLRHRLSDAVRLHDAPLIDGIYRKEDLCGLLSPTPACDDPRHTVTFISHLHLDHMSYFGMLDNRVDVYMSEPAQKLEALLETVGLGSDNIRTVPAKPMHDREAVHVGEITVLPFLLCTQSYQDWSFYVETPDVKLHYTGDLVMHGEYLDNVLREMEYVKAQHPDLLVCEATTFMDSTLEMVYGRTDVTVEPDVNLPKGMLDKCGLDAELETLLAQQTGLCVFNFYQREMADVMSFRTMAEHCGRELVFEPETAYVVWKFFNKPVLVWMPDSPRFTPEEIARKPWLQALLKVNRVITREELCAAPAHYLLQNSYEYSMELMDLPADNGAYLHAGGMPIGTYDPAYQNLMKVLQFTGFKYVTFFAKNYFSHAYPCQVKYYVDQIDAKILVPSHSQNPERLLPSANGIQFLPVLRQPYYYQDGKLLPWKE